MNNFFNATNPEHIQTIKRLITEVVEVMSVDFLNKLGGTSGLSDDLVKEIKETTLSMTEDEGQTIIIVNVEFVDKDNNPEGNAFIFIGKDEKIYLDFPY